MNINDLFPNHQELKTKLGKHAFNEEAYWNDYSGQRTSDELRDFIKSSNFSEREYWDYTNQVKIYNFLDKHFFGGLTTLEKGLDFVAQEKPLSFYTIESNECHYGDNMSAPELHLISSGELSNEGALYVLKNLKKKPDALALVETSKNKQYLLMSGVNPYSGTHNGYRMFAFGKFEEEPFNGIYRYGSTDSHSDLALLVTDNLAEIIEGEGNSFSPWFDKKMSERNKQYSE